MNTTKEKNLIIGLIPLKSKSRRLHNKNFSNFCNTNILLHTIEKMQKSNSFDAIIISTDEPEQVREFIESASKTRIPTHTVNCSDDFVYLSGIIILKRDNGLSDDNTRTEEVIFDTINKIDLFIGNEQNYTIVLCQATSPNWKSHIIRYALELHNSKKKTIISVAPNFNPNGCLYIFDKKEFLKTLGIFTSDIFLIKMTWDESIDIDYYYQLCISEAVMKGNYDDR